MSMSVEDDQAWLDALAGSVPADGSQSPAVLEALALRELIRVQPDAVGPGDARADVPVIDPRREEDLIALARATGLLPSQTSGATALHDAGAGREGSPFAPTGGMPGGVSARERRL